MLLSLKIENYALIRSSQIELSQGFTSICGETGAGKSILLGALGLVLGQRADTEVLLDKEKKCYIEAIFTISKDLKPLFEDNDLDYEEESCFRREINPNGKSRAFINDTPVSLSVMKQIGDMLLDIHSQHNTINLNDKVFQLAILDSHLEKSEIKKEYDESFNKFSKLKNKIDELKNQLLDFQKESSYINHIYEELENSKLKEGEQEELEESVELMSNSENIKTFINNSISLFETEDYPSVITNLYEIKNNISKISDVNKTTKELYERIDSAFIELKDIYAEMQNFNDSINYDPQLLETQNQRLDLIYRLQEKHNVETVTDLINLKDSLSQQINQNTDLEYEISQLENEKQTLEDLLTQLSELIIKDRKSAAERVEQALLPLFESMGMKNAILKIEIEKTETLNKNAGCQVEFLFNANKSIATTFRPLNKVASGGELSRLMLALKAIHLTKQDLPTLIFDEIDSGISGDIAAKVANIMKNMSENRQIIAITHLPQIAAKADYQFKVYKNDVNQQTESNITLLNEEERVVEIAKMLSGENPSQAALANSRELLS